jgi:hypothetical protein
MEKNPEIFDDIMGKLALLADGLENVFPNSKGMIVFELNPVDFIKTKVLLTKQTNSLDKFTIDISGVDIIFMRGES